jgi:hypothetical protein
MRFFMSLPLIRQFLRFYHGKPGPQPSDDDFVAGMCAGHRVDERSSHRVAGMTISRLAAPALRRIAGAARRPRYCNSVSR